MADLIDRQAVVNVICEMHVGGQDAVKNALPNTYGADLREIIEEIDALPSADIDLIGFSDKLWAAAYERGKAEVVRCKDCKHQVKEWRTDKRLKNKGYMVCGCEVVGDSCGYWALLGQDDDYCSMAERRTDA